MVARIGVVASTLLLSVACSQTGFLNGEQGNNSIPLARGISVDRVSVYQGVEARLADGGVAVGPAVPVIAGRDAHIRVFPTLDDGFEDRVIRARLTVDNAEGSETYEVEQVVDRPGADNDLWSTFDFDLPAATLTGDASFEVELEEETKRVEIDGSDAGAVYPADGKQGFGATASDHIEVVLIPVRYNADGSGRLPDTSDEQVRRYQDLFYSMYPVEDVTVTVGEPLNWNQQISPYGQGWDNLLYHVATMRAQAHIEPNTYYYAIFRTTSTLGQFCGGGGCILGLSPVGSANDVWSRASIGVGYAGNTAVETAVHEVGHAHGREHAPCGIGNQPSDPGFPYNGGSIGVWGYDLITGELKDPSSHADLMGYCTPLWVSDYNYSAFLQRIRALDAQAVLIAPELDEGWQSMLLAPDGTVKQAEPIELTEMPRGELRDVALYDGDDALIGETDGFFYPFDHLDGGILLVPDHGAPVHAAEIR